MGAVRLVLVMVIIACSGCANAVSTCYPLAARGPGRCPANEDWRRFMASANERGWCDDDDETRCCLIDGRECCMDDSEVRCSQ